MDYRTGLVGLSCGISWRSPQEALYVEPGPGLVGTGTSTKAKLRRLAERMARAGLATNRHTQNQKQLVFFLPLAPRDAFAPNKPGTKKVSINYFPMSFALISFWDDADLLRVRCCQ